MSGHLRMHPQIISGNSSIDNYHCAKSDHMFTNQTIVSTDPPSVTSAQEARTNASTTGDTEHIFVVTTYWWDVG